jgi:mono/diheme cytochrome c family protein
MGRVVSTVGRVSAVLALIVLPACGGDDDSGGDDSANAAATADGAALYAANCAECHGTELQGTDKGPPHLSIVYAPDHHPDDSFRRAIADGVPAHHWEFGDMPPVEGLSDEQVDAIIAFVREEQERQGFEPYPPE